MRTLLLAIVVCSAALAAVGSQLRSQAAQRRVLVTLERYGPSVVFSHGNVVALSLKRSDICDEFAQQIGKLKHLEQLDLDWTNISDKGVEQLSRLP
jgi:hypothetical protein